ncbi:hypothetical protein SAMN02745126_00865 [Enhydrobacter aerosaccus]|uniref:Lipoprotein n=1 Tax=Enhydrobacter aerosaccus TaxID=225324 RepID=A0A1T4KBD7_9HYPH|nr:hypothetical protein [Enhydrobacter aerosaccus]SJZ39712.1 hypothetical protein SAMN02745126_00865 [Enhydrobacter aerosaccus]
MKYGIALAVALAAVGLLSGCTQPSDDARAKNPDKYDRDRSDCQAQVNDYMKTRRRVDSSRQDVFRGEQDRFGQSALPTQMDNYSDNKASDRVMANCMEAKGWAQPARPWWDRIGR